MSYSQVARTKVLMMTFSELVGDSKMVPGQSWGTFYQPVTQLQRHSLWHKTRNRCLNPHIMLRNGWMKYLSRGKQPVRHVLRYRLTKQCEQRVSDNRY